MPQLSRDSFIHAKFARTVTVLRFVEKNGVNLPCGCISVQNKNNLCGRFLDIYWCLYLVQGDRPDSPIHCPDYPGKKFIITNLGFDAHNDDIS